MKVDLKVDGPETLKRESERSKSLKLGGPEILKSERSGCKKVNGSTII